MIKFAINTGTTVSLSKIKPFQHEMKTMSQENYIRLRREIEETGFSFAPHVWFDGKDYNCLDGHQRVECLKRIIKDQMIDDIEVPVVLVEAKDYFEAKRKCLAAASQYGTFNAENLVKMLSEVKMTPIEASNHFHFPEINFDNLMKSVAKTETDDPEESRYSEEGLEAYKSAAIKQIIMYFGAEEYEEIMRKCSELMQENNLESISELFVKVINEAHRG